MFRSTMQLQSSLRDELYHAAYAGDTARMKTLLRGGASMDTASAQRRFVHLALTSGDLELLKLLLERGCSLPEHLDSSTVVEYLHDAADDGDAELLQLLLAQGGDRCVNEVIPGSHDTALHLACRGGHLQVVRVLLRHGADLNGRSSTRRCLYDESFEFFVDENVTPLHVAAEGGHFDVTEELLKRKPDINALTDYGYTPLHLAVMENHVDIVHLLLRHGARVSPTNKDGKSALDIAKEGKRLKVLRVIETHMADVITDVSTEETTKHTEEIIFIKEYIKRVLKRKMKGDDRPAKQRKVSESEDTIEEIYSETINVDSTATEVEEVDSIESAQNTQKVTVPAAHQKDGFKHGATASRPDRLERDFATISEEVDVSHVSVTTQPMATASIEQLSQVHDSSVPSASEVDSLAAPGPSTAGMEESPNVSPTAQVPPAATAATGGLVIRRVELITETWSVRPKTAVSEPSSGTRITQQSSAADENRPLLNQTATDGGDKMSDVGVELDPNRSLSSESLNSSWQSLEDRPIIDGSVVYRSKKAKKGGNANRHSTGSLGSTEGEGAYVKKAWLHRTQSASHSENDDGGTEGLACKDGASGSTEQPHGTVRITGRTFMITGEPVPFADAEQADAAEQTVVRSAIVSREELNEGSDIFEEESISTEDKTREDTKSGPLVIGLSHASWTEDGDIVLQSVEDVSDSVHHEKPQDRQVQHVMGDSDEEEYLSNQTLEAVVSLVKDKLLSGESEDDSSESYYEDAAESFDVEISKHDTISSMPYENLVREEYLDDSAGIQLPVSLGDDSNSSSREQKEELNKIQVASEVLSEAKAIQSHNILRSEDRGVVKFERPTIPEEDTNRQFREANKVMETTTTTTTITNVEPAPIEKKAQLSTKIFVDGEKIPSGSITESDDKSVTLPEEPIILEENTASQNTTDNEETETTMIEEIVTVYTTIDRSAVIGDTPGVSWSGRNEETVPVPLRQDSKEKSVPEEPEEQTTESATSDQMQGADAKYSEENTLIQQKISLIEDNLMKSDDKNVTSISEESTDRQNKKDNKERETVIEETVTVYITTEHTDETGDALGDSWPGRSEKSAPVLFKQDLISISDTGEPEKQTVSKHETSTSDQMKENNEDCSEKIPSMQQPTWLIEDLVDQNRTQLSTETPLEIQSPSIIESDDLSVTTAKEPLIAEENIDSPNKDDDDEEEEETETTIIEEIITVYTTTKHAPAVSWKEATGETELSPYKHDLMSTSDLDEAKTASTDEFAAFEQIKKEDETHLRETSFMQHAPSLNDNEIGKYSTQLASGKPEDDQGIFSPTTGESDDKSGGMIKETTISEEHHERYSSDDDQETETTIIEEIITVYTTTEHDTLTRNPPGVSSSWIEQSEEREPLLYEHDMMSPSDSEDPSKQTSSERESLNSEQMIKDDERYSVEIPMMQQIPSSTVNQEEESDKQMFMETHLDGQEIPSPSILLSQNQEASSTLTASGATPEALQVSSVTVMLNRVQELRPDLSVYRTTDSGTETYRRSVHIEGELQESYPAEMSPGLCVQTTIIPDTARTDTVGGEHKTDHETITLSQVTGSEPWPVQFEGNDPYIYEEEGVTVIRLTQQTDTEGTTAQPISPECDIRMNEMGEAADGDSNAMSTQESIHNIPGSAIEQDAMQLLKSPDENETKDIKYIDEPVTDTTLRIIPPEIFKQQEEDYQKRVKNMQSEDSDQEDGFNSYYKKPSSLSLIKQSVAKQTRKYDDYHDEDPDQFNNDLVSTSQDGSPGFKETPARIVGGYPLSLEGSNRQSSEHRKSESTHLVIKGKEIEQQSDPDLLIDQSLQPNNDHQADIRKTQKSQDARSVEIPPLSVGTEAGGVSMTSKEKSSTGSTHARMQYVDIIKPDEGKSGLKQQEPPMEDVQGSDSGDEALYVGGPTIDAAMSYMKSKYDYDSGKDSSSDIVNVTQREAGESLSTFEVPSQQGRSLHTHSHERSQNEYRDSNRKKQALPLFHTVPSEKVAKERLEHEITVKRPGERADGHPHVTDILKAKPTESREFHASNKSQGSTEGTHSQERQEEELSMSGQPALLEYSDQMSHEMRRSVEARAAKATAESPEERGDSEDKSKSDYHRSVRLSTNGTVSVEVDIKTEQKVVPEEGNALEKETVTIKKKSSKKKLEKDGKKKKKKKKSSEIMAVDKPEGNKAVTKQEKPPRPTIVRDQQKFTEPSPDGNGRHLHSSLIDVERATYRSDHSRLESADILNDFTDGNMRELQSHQTDLPAIETNASNTSQLMTSEMPISANKEVADLVREDQTIVIQEYRILESDEAVGTGESPFAPRERKHSKGQGKPSRPSIRQEVKAEEHSPGEAKSVHKDYEVTRDDDVFLDSPAVQVGSQVLSIQQNDMICSPDRFEHDIPSIASDQIESPTDRKEQMLVEEYKESEATIKKKIKKKKKKPTDSSGVEEKGIKKKKKKKKSTEIVTTIDSGIKQPKFPEIGEHQESEGELRASQTEKATGVDIVGPQAKTSTRLDRQELETVVLPTGSIDGARTTPSGLVEDQPANQRRALGDRIEDIRIQEIKIQHDRADQATPQEELDTRRYIKDSAIVDPSIKREITTTVDLAIVDRSDMTPKKKSHRPALLPEDGPDEGHHIPPDVSEEHIIDAVVDADQSEIVAKIDQIIMASIVNVRSKYAGQKYSSESSSLSDTEDGRLSNMPESNIFDNQAEGKYATSHVSQVPCVEKIQGLATQGEEDGPREYTITEEQQSILDEVSTEKDKVNAGVKLVRREEDTAERQQSEHRRSLTRVTNLDDYIHLHSPPQMKKIVLPPAQQGSQPPDGDLAGYHKYTTIVATVKSSAESTESLKENKHPPEGGTSQTAVKLDHPHPIESPVSTQTPVRTPGHYIDITPTSKCVRDDNKFDDSLQRQQEYLPRQEDQMEDRYVQQQQTDTGKALEEGSSGLQEDTETATTVQYSVESSKISKPDKRKKKTLKRSTKHTDIKFTDPHSMEIPASSQTQGSTPGNYIDITPTSKHAVDVSTFDDSLQRQEKYLSQHQDQEEHRYGQQHHAMTEKTLDEGSPVLQKDTTTITTVSTENSEILKADKRKKKTPKRSTKQTDIKFTDPHSMEIPVSSQTQGSTPGHFINITPTSKHIVDVSTFDDSLQRQEKYLSQHQDQEEHRYGQQHHTVTEKTLDEGSPVLQKDTTSITTVSTESSEILKADKRKKKTPKRSTKQTDIKFTDPHSMEIPVSSQTQGSTPGNYIDITPTSKHTVDVSTFDDSLQRQEKYLSQHQDQEDHWHGHQHHTVTEMTLNDGSTQLQKNTATIASVQYSTENSEILKADKLKKKTPKRSTKQTDIKFTDPQTMEIPVCSQTQVSTPGHFIDITPTSKHRVDVATFGDSLQRQEKYLSQYQDQEEYFHGQQHHTVTDKTLDEGSPVLQKDMTTITTVSTESSEILKANKQKKKSPKGSTKQTDIKITEPHSMEIPVSSQTEVSTTGHYIDITPTSGYPGGKSRFDDDQQRQHDRQFKSQDRALSQQSNLNKGQYIQQPRAEMSQTSEVGSPALDTPKGSNIEGDERSHCSYLMETSDYQLTQTPMPIHGRFIDITPTSAYAVDEGQLYDNLQRCHSKEVQPKEEGLPQENDLKAEQYGQQQQTETRQETETVTTVTMKKSKEKSKKKSKKAEGKVKRKKRSISPDAADDAIIAGQGDDLPTVLITPTKTRGSSDFDTNGEERVDGVSPRGIAATSTPEQEDSHTDKEHSRGEVPTSPVTSIMTERTPARPVIHIMPADSKQRKIEDVQLRDDLLYERNSSTRSAPRPKSSDGRIVFRTADTSGSPDSVSNSSKVSGDHNKRPLSVPDVYALASLTGGSFSDLGVLRKDEDNIQPQYPHINSSSPGISFQSDPSFDNSDYSYPKIYMTDMRTKSMDELDMVSSKGKGHEVEADPGLVRTQSGGALHSPNVWTDSQRKSKPGYREVVMPDTFFENSPLVRANAVYRGDDSLRSRSSSGSVHFKGQDQVAVFHSQDHVGGAHYIHFPRPTAAPAGTQPKPRSRPRSAVLPIQPSGSVNGSDRRRPHRSLSAEEQRPPRPVEGTPQAVRLPVPKHRDSRLPKQSGKKGKSPDSWHPHEVTRRVGQSTTRRPKSAPEGQTTTPGQVLLSPPGEHVRSSRGTTRVIPIYTKYPTISALCSAAQALPQVLPHQQNVRREAVPPPSGQKKCSNDSSGLRVRIRQPARPQDDNTEIW